MFYIFSLPGKLPLDSDIGIKNVREIYANGSKLSLVVSYSEIFCGRRSLTGNFSFSCKVLMVLRARNKNLSAYKGY